MFEKNHNHSVNDSEDCRENRELFLARLKEKLRLVTKDWPEWKHNVLITTGRCTNLTPRQPVDNESVDL